MVGYKINIQKSVAFIYTYMQTTTEDLKKGPHFQDQQNKISAHFSLKQKYTTYKEHLKNL